LTDPTYRVTLEVFEGPLDLLLQLIEREELDITRVSLALVADQYLAYLAVLREVAADSLADFLVVAAKLLLIKSRSLLPPPEEPEDDEDEEDVGEELARQLLEYKRFKDVATRLRSIEEAGRRAYARVVPSPKVDQRLLPGEVSLEELLQALKRVLEAHPPVPPVDGVVAPVVVHIGDCIQAIEETVRRYTRVHFSTLMRRARSRLEVIVTFLAVLELIKQQRLQAVQEQPFGEIYLEARQPDPDIDIVPTDPTEYGENGAQN
jgi:segregation and condensation protein A